MSFFGIDVSQWNGSVNFKAVKESEIDFVIIRSSYGNVAAYPGQKDWQFDTNVRKCKDVGMAWGVYHYSYFTTVEGAKAEAKGFIDLLNAVKPIPYIVALDIEERSQYYLSGGQLEACTKAFIDEVEKAGYFCALYSYESFLTKYSQAFRDKYMIWCANTSKKPAIKHGIWQYSFKGRIAGISGEVDLDTTDSDYYSLIKNNGFNGYTKTEKPKNEPKLKPITDIANEVINGKWGNGKDREQRLTAAGYNYNAVQAEVNKILSRKSVDTIAREVIRGEWGNGADRVNRLKAAGYDPQEVQTRVNQLLRG